MTPVGEHQPQRKQDAGVVRREHQRPLVVVPRLLVVVAQVIELPDARVAGPVAGAKLDRPQVGGFGLVDTLQLVQHTSQGTMAAVEAE